LNPQKTFNRQLLPSPHFFLQLLPYYTPFGQILFSLDGDDGIKGDTVLAMALGARESTVA
jgi:hypothetical protein